MAEFYEEIFLTVDGTNHTWTYDGQPCTVYVGNDFGGGDVTVETSDGVENYPERAADTTLFKYTVGEKIPAGQDIIITVNNSTTPNVRIRIFRAIVG